MATDKVDALSVKCPKCEQGVGVQCREIVMVKPVVCEFVEPHQARIAAAREAQKGRDDK